MFGQRKLPAELKTEMERDERVLAWSASDDGGALVATNRGLWLPDAGGQPRRLAWHEVHKATWADGVLTVTGASSAPLSPDSDIRVSSDTEPVSFTLPSPGGLPKRVRERVSASVAYTNLRQMPRGGAARIVGRRISGRDGLSWFVRYEGRVDPTDPAVISATAELVDAARTGLGQVDQDL